MALNAIVREIYKSEARYDSIPVAEGQPEHEQDEIHPEALGCVLYRNHQPVYVYRFWGTGREKRAAKCKAQWEAGASWANQEIYQ